MGKQRCQDCLGTGKVSKQKKEKGKPVEIEPVDCQGCGGEGWK